MEEDCSSHCCWKETPAEVTSMMPSVVKRQLADILVLGSDLDSRPLASTS